MVNDVLALGTSYFGLCGLQSMWEKPMIDTSCYSVSNKRYWKELTIILFIVSDVATFGNFVLRTPRLMFGRTKTATLNQRLVRVNDIILLRQWYEPKRE